MGAIILVVQLFLAVILIGIILVQRSSTSGLGLGDGNSGGGLGGMMSGRSSANMLTRATAFIAAGFLATCLISAILAAQGRQGSSVADIERAAETQAEQSSEVPAAPSAPTTSAASDNEGLLQQLDTTAPATPSQ
ncbi:MAG: preprotein translocase subunit SecG [Alphaproteobacteria bacterium]